MPCSYISSNQNRLYVGLEATYGGVPAITCRNRIPAVKLTAKQQIEQPSRRDKTGSRTYTGRPAGLRKRTNYELRVYMSSWTEQDGPPGCGPLFEAGLGGSPTSFDGGTAGSGSTARVLRFASAHGLGPGQAVTAGGELRFVASIVDSLGVELNAPLSAAPAAGTPVGRTITYAPEAMPGSVSIFDYWDPSPAVHRVIAGAAVDRMRVRVNGDYHEFAFSGPARDVLDSGSFSAGEGGLASFPSEPEIDSFDYSIIPGHLGQAWLGSAPDRFQTLTAAELLVDNSIKLRTNEFGCELPQCVAPGDRAVTLDFELYEQDNTATKELYQAARSQSPIAAMFQLGQQAGQLFGVYLKSVVPEVPQFDDSDTRLQWRFTNCRAQGTGDDEIFVAFG